jgi:hypothetical protein
VNKQLEQKPTVAFTDQNAQPWIGGPSATRAGSKTDQRAEQMFGRFENSQGRTLRKAAEPLAGAHWGGR